MGVYIKDLKKPKGCYECPIAKSYLDCLMEKKYVCPIGHADDCPLIEIDLDEKKLEYMQDMDIKNYEQAVFDLLVYKPINLERDIPTIWYNRQTGLYEPKGTKQEVYERLYKLKYGERRADEHTD